MEKWKSPLLIRGEQTCEMVITEKEDEGERRISRKVIIKKGKVIKKPADVNILGTNTSGGFMIHGLEIVRKRKLRNIILKKDEIKEETENECKRC